MHNRISKVEVIDDHSIRCEFYSGDVKKLDVSHFGDYPRGEHFLNVKITNNGDCISWPDCNFKLYAIDAWIDGMTVDAHHPNPRYQLARLMSYYRETLNLKQKDLEARTGITQSDISKYERGEGNASLETICRIADAFDMNVTVDFRLKSSFHEVDLEEFTDIMEIFDYLPKHKKQGEFTLSDMELIPEEYRVEMIDGRIQMMGHPSVVHQMIASYFNVEIGVFIRKNKGKCVFMQCPALEFHNKDIHNTYLVPDIAVVCNRENLNRRGIYNNTDWVIEIVSPGDENRKRDYITKVEIYLKAGVREYWIVDTEKQKLTVYSEKNDYMPMLHGFDQVVPVGIYDGKLKIDLREIQEILVNYEDLD